VALVPAAQRNGSGAAADLARLLRYYHSLLASQVLASNGKAAVTWSRCWAAFIFFRILLPEKTNFYT
jgi:hypothetical protein